MIKSRYKPETKRELVLKQIERFQKKVPKRGFKNVSYTGIPTLVTRLDNLMWTNLYLPPQLLILSKLTHDDRERIRESFQNIIDNMTKIKLFLDTDENMHREHKVSCLSCLNVAKRRVRINMEKFGFVIDITEK